MKLQQFEVEKWMDDHEVGVKHNLGESCCASISLSSLLALSQPPGDATSFFDFAKRQDYGEVRGLTSLRRNLSALYSARSSTPVPIDKILITPGAIVANFLVYYALLNPGDHVICQYPTYQQLYSVPESLGAEVDLWKARAEDKWVPDIEELKKLIKPNTKMLILNNPCNPTGAILPRPLLEKIMDLAAEHKLIVHSDEAYRPMFHSIGPMDSNFPPSMLTLSLTYDRTIVTGTMSKAYALAGVRVGWIASRSSELVEACAGARQYTTISVSELDQQVAAFALGQNCIHGLLGRNIGLAKKNLAILEDFVNSNSQSCQWVKPLAGSTAFIRFTRGGKPVDAVAFCEALQARMSLLIVPGNRSFGEDFSGYVRIGFVTETDALVAGLAQLTEFLKSHFGDIATVEP